MEYETRTVLIHFLQQQQTFIPVLLTDPNNVIMWEAFFHFVYGEAPQDVVVAPTPPLERRAGSTDPRWDELLHVRKALRAMQEIRENWLVYAITIPIIEEAA